MSSSNNNPQGNIFLTTENLAFAMPLIVVCSTYAYFKIVPLKYGIPILAGVFVFFQVQGQVKTLREKKIENMDESDINDLAMEFEGDEDDSKKKEGRGKTAKEKGTISRTTSGRTTKGGEGRKTKSRQKKRNQMMMTTTMPIWLCLQRDRGT